MAVAAWTPAPDGARWAAIDAAWLVLAALVEAADREDVRTRS